MAEENSTPQSEDATPDPPAPEDVSAGDMAESALSNAESAAQAIGTETGSADDITAFELPDVDGAPVNGTHQAAGLALLNEVALKVKIELGRTHMYVEDVLKLNADAIIELDKAAGDPVDIYVNDRLVARGEVLVLNENFCVRVSEIIDHVVDETD